MPLHLQEEYQKNRMIGKQERQFIQDDIIKRSIFLLKPIVDSLNIQKYSKEFQSILARYNDPELKLAVIGDFNTGKSTFINALMKSDTLSMDNVPTTVIPTYIRWNGKKNSKPIVKIKLAGDENEYSLSHYEVLGKKLGIEITNDFESVERIITNNSLIGKVEHVSISYPKDQRFENLCIIDTPGVNPGAEETQEHANITREVLRKEADSTIILFPAHAVGQRSSLEYLSENASHLIDGSSFVITKMDLVEGEKEEKKLPDFLRGLIKQRFQIEPEKIYTCSARNALYHYLGKRKDQAHADLFDNMITEMMADINDNRKNIICRKIVELITPLLAELKDEQTKNSSELDEQLAILEQYSINNLKLEFNTLQDRYVEKIGLKYTELYNNASNRVSTIKDSKLSSIKWYLDEYVDDIFSLREYVKSGIDDDIKGFEKEIISGIKDDIGKIKGEYSLFSKNVTQCINKYQIGVGKMRETSNKAEAPTALAIPSVDVTTGAIISGIGIAALLLTFINPLTLLGIIGGVAIFGRNVAMNLAKKRIYSKVEEGLNNSADSISTSWRDALRKAKGEYETAGKTLLERYETQYAELFKKKKEQYISEKNALNSEKAEVDSKYRTLAAIESALKIPSSSEHFADCPKEHFVSITRGDNSAIEKICSCFSNDNEKHSMWMGYKTLIKETSVIQ